MPWDVTSRMRDCGYEDAVMPPVVFLEGVERTIGFVLVLVIDRVMCALS